MSEREFAAEISYRASSEAAKLPFFDQRAA